MHTQPLKYSWFNVTKNKEYKDEDKELLNIQRMAGDECTNVTSGMFTKKQLRKRKNGLTR